jgi:hypothetical protein
MSLRFVPNEEPMDIGVTDQDAGEASSQANAAASSETDEPHGSIRVAHDCELFMRSGSACALQVLQADDVTGLEP